MKTKTVAEAGAGRYVVNIDGADKYASGTIRNAVRVASQVRDRSRKPRISIRDTTTQRFIVFPMYGAELRDFAVELSEPN